MADRDVMLKVGDTFAGSYRIVGEVGSGNNGVVYLARHELLDRDPKTGLYPYLGYVIEGNGVTIYHSGDCCLYEGIAAKLRQWKLDLALLPINGRDAWRFTHDIIGCMTYQEAADLAGAIRPKRVMPAHYDMFAANTEDPQKFLDYVHVKYPDLVTELPPTGKVAVY